MEEGRFSDKNADLVPYLHQNQGAVSYIFRKMGVKISTLLRGTLFYCLMNLLLGCAPLPGTLRSGDSPPTNGTLLYQGGFTSSSSVSGGAKVYLVNGLIVLFLENYSAPTGTQYTVFLSTTTVPDFYHTVLKASVGSQTYATGLPSPGPGTPFTQATIRLNSSTSSTLFATAYLSSVLPVSTILTF